jgi:hypothetical protein
MTTDTLAIRAAIERILNELDLCAFIFTHEAKENGLELHVECATNGAWRTISLPADPAQLLASLSDPRVRERLRQAWSDRLRDCTKGAA